MRTLAGMMAVVGMLAALGSARAGEKEAKEIIERGIKSHGGVEAMTKALVCKRTDKGTQALGGKEEPFVSEVSRSLPDKVRLKIEMGKKFTTTIVLDGETGYQSEGNGPGGKMLAPRLREVREEAYLWWITTLVPLTKPGFKLSTVPEVKINGEAAVGVKVEQKGHADTKLYFNKRNGLLVRAERRVFEAGLGVDKEYNYEVHKRFGSAILATKETLKLNNRKWTEFTISDYSFPEKFDASVFAKP